MTEAGDCAAQKEQICLFEMDGTEKYRQKRAERKINVDEGKKRSEIGRQAAAIFKKSIHLNKTSAGCGPNYQKSQSSREITMSNYSRLVTYVLFFNDYFHMQFLMCWTAETPSSVSGLTAVKMLFISRLSTVTCVRAKTKRSSGVQNGSKAVNNV